MTEAVRVLLTAVVLSAVALAVAAIRLARTPPGSPERLVGQLHLSQWAALVLTIDGAITVGLAIATPSAAGAATDLLVALLFIVVAALVLRAEPPVALAVAAFALGIHAALAFAHRPGWWPADLAPAWFWLGQALFDLYVATLCLWGASGRSRP